ncbi:O-antigen ligase family protein [Marinobacter sp. X15-166B]|uniref:O-antigen ligase family protein n=1 Tax=Marinobacter sp. X15-166B TaxID=1897620 RepID=UPI00085C3B97|nr:O-antigen ligase family protein [Marinobacter sp. X15-166B]OEY65173.1 hypothetical protein BG841_00965 [Marinobacter sp. X15-166B]
MVQKDWGAFRWLIAVAIFVSVLFADLLPLSIGSYAFQRYILAGGLALTVSLSGAYWVNQKGWGEWRNIWPVLLAVASLVLLAAPYHDLLYVWVEPGMYVAFFLGFVLVGGLSGEGGHKQRWVIELVYIAAAAVFAYGAATITVYLFALSDRVAHLSNYIPWGFVSMRYWSHIATWLLPILPLAVLLGPLKDERLWRFFVALGAALWWWIEFLSMSRGSVLGIAIGVVLAAVLIGRPALPWLRVFVRYLAYGVFAWVILSVIIPSMFQDEVGMRILHTTSSGRVPLFIEAWRMSLENFPFGMGPQSWLTHDILTDEYRQSPKFGHPHNMYLMWAAEYGWILIGALFFLVGQAIRLFWQRRAEVHAGDRDGLALPLAAFTASVSAAMLHAGVSAVFMAPGSMLIGFLVLSVFWVLITPEHDPATPKRSRRRFVAAGLVAMFLGGLSLYWFSEVKAYYSAMENDLQYYQKHVPAGTLPRFWFHGNFPRHPDQMP